MDDASRPFSRLSAAIAVDAGPQSPLTRRAFDEPPHPYRSPFARDGARVLHTRAFRRLAGKTQVFTRLPGGAISDHFRSRLTHTLEVAQISRTLAAAMGLNADLAEALALAHDIGHPPFGHAGEKALHRALKAHGLSFDHNLHALRIVTWFEERYAAFRGLNLTLGVREGIVKHSRDYPVAEFPQLADFFLDQLPPLEAQLIDLTDEIAYLTSDLDDGLSSGILSLDQIREGLPLFRRLHDQSLAAWPGAALRLTVNETLKRMLDAWATDLMRHLSAEIAALGIETLDQVRSAPRRLVTLSSSVEAERAGTKRFLYANLYNAPVQEEAHGYADAIVTALFAALMESPGMLPADHQQLIPGEGLARTVADYIAGMTDNYVEQVWLRCGGGL